VGLAGWFEYIVTRASHLIVLQISPASLQYVAMYGSWMTMAAENAGAANPQKIAPGPIQRVQHQRPEPDTFGLRNPDSFVFGYSLYHEILWSQWVSG
jgi:hypothetical protein